MNNPRLLEVKYLAQFIFEEYEYSDFMFLFNIKAYKSALLILEETIERLEMELLKEEGDEPIILQCNHAIKLLRIVKDLIIENERIDDGREFKIRNSGGRLQARPRIKVKLFENIRFCTKWAKSVIR